MAEGKSVLHADAIVFNLNPQPFHLLERPGKSLGSHSQIIGDRLLSERQAKLQIVVTGLQMLCQKIIADLLKGVLIFMASIWCIAFL